MVSDALVTAHKALTVIALNVRVSSWLEENDPQALVQVVTAIEEVNAAQVLLMEGDET